MNQVTKATPAATANTSTNTLRADLLARAKTLAPFLESRAGAAEEAGTLPSDVVAKCS